MTHPALAALVGESLPMQRLRALIATAAPTALNVLIEGPTGAGKELVAHALHALSGRPGAFVAINVAAISEAMFEDALFGHVRGAFTGAVRDHCGFLREAHGGTVFLDEIGALPLAQQVKLLRAIETRTFRPVGARYDVQSDFRGVVATNERLDECADAGMFRTDLLHRVSAVRIRVPSLAERLEDIPALVQHFMSGSGATVTPDVLEELQRRPWHGNVRELRNAVQWAMAAGNGDLDVAALRTLDGHRSTAHERGVGRGTGQQRLRVRQVLESHSWDTRGAAAELGVNRATLYRWMQRFQLALPGKRAVM